MLQFVRHLTHQGLSTESLAISSGDSTDYFDLLDLIEDLGTLPPLAHRYIQLAPCRQIEYSWGVGLALFYLTRLP